ncbi:MAG TPA: transglycosylase domain-containing protein [Steroidobacteraceae bacterium]|nr:transglycosylase domain-containing protein [Steroidobacteraceae bacterium]
MISPIWRRVAAGACGAAVLLGLATRLSMREFPPDLRSLDGTAVKSQILARDGMPLSYTLTNDWNSTDLVPLSDVPTLLKTAFIVAEDQHFYEHHGVDWPARFAALWLDVRQGAAVRGASSITEQVVRMIHPRPRNLWSRWVEGFEAARLDARLSKDEILSFYLNQVPYTERRRGVLQAAHFYFDRGLDTLSPGETLALAVLVRSPAGMDLRRNAPRARRALDQLADRMQQRGELTAGQREQIRNQPWVIDDSAVALEASHFVVHALSLKRAPPVMAQVRTTLDPHVQVTAQKILDRALGELAKRHVRDAAVLVIDHRRNEILAWVVGKGGRLASDSSTVGYDTILTPRQPGSTMKPLLYALALERGWTAATMINDAELSESVGGGQHTFQNYSRRHYGLLRLREALGNSLNIPAVKALKFVGEDAFMARLHQMGITSLTQHPDFYGDGLALGNGEISLYEMAQAYTVLAREGRYKPLTVLAAESATSPEEKIFDPDVATLIGNILSDPDARMLEFGRGLQFPVETAIKTGTSTDYRDAWAIAFDYRHTVAVWMGNLDGSAMDGVTGAVGPAMVLRSLFSELNRDQDTRPLPLGHNLIAAKICRRDGHLADDACASTTEWFLPGTLPPPESATALATAPQFHVLQPTAGLQVAHDPRIPAELEALPMEIAPVRDLRQVDWYVDGKLAATTMDTRYPWPLQRGTHDLRATIWTDAAHDTEDIRFHVR